MTLMRMLRQILLRDGIAEAIVLADEILDEFVQAALENLVDAGVGKFRQHRAREALGISLAAVELREIVEIAAEIFVAACKRSRHLVIQNEKIGDKPGLHAFLIDPVVARERRDR